jgi:hypothetical protein
VGKKPSTIKFTSYQGRDHKVFKTRFIYMAVKSVGISRFSVTASFPHHNYSSGLKAEKVQLTVGELTRKVLEKPEAAVGEMIRRALKGDVHLKVYLKE